jgi:hypothetical protein
MAFRLELFIIHPGPLLLARTPCCRPSYIGLEKLLTWRGSVQLNLTPPSRRLSCGLGKDLCKMALVGESALERYFN